MIILRSVVRNKDMTCQWKIIVFASFDILFILHKMGSHQFPCSPNFGSAILKRNTSTGPCDKHIIHITNSYRVKHITSSHPNRDYSKYAGSKAQNHLFTTMWLKLQIELSMLKRHQRNFKIKVSRNILLRINLFIEI